MVGSSLPQCELAHARCSNGSRGSGSPKRQRPQVASYRWDGGPITGNREVGGATWEHSGERLLRVLWATFVWLWRRERENHIETKGCATSAAEGACW